MNSILLYSLIYLSKLHLIELCLLKERNHWWKGILLFHHTWMITLTHYSSIYGFILGDHKTKSNDI